MILLLAVLISLVSWGCSLENFGGHGEDCVGMDWGDFEKRPLLDSFGGVQGAVCLGMDENMGDVNKHIICCPVTRTCLTEAECYDWSGDGDMAENDADENPPDGDADNDVVDETEDEITPDEDQDPVDGDEDADTNDIDFEDGFSGQVCSPDGLCWISSLPQGNDVNAIWISPERSVWLAGESGLLMDFNGFNSFENARTSNADPDFHDIYGKDGQVFAVGGNGLVRKFDTLEWKTVSAPPNSEGVMLNSVFIDTTGVIYVVGENGAVYNSVEGVWSILRDVNYSLNDIYGVTDENKSVYIAVGDNGNGLLSADGFKFNQFESPFEGKNINAVWGGATDSFIAVGEDETIMYFDGNGWQEFAYEPPVEVDGDTEQETAAEKMREAGGDDDAETVDEIPDLYDVFGVGDNVYIVGDNSTILHLVAGDNTNAGEDVPQFIKEHYWEKIEAPFVSDLRTVGLTEAGELIVAGLNGDIRITAESISTWYEVNSKPLYELVPSEVEDDPDSYELRNIKAMSGSLMTAAFVGLSDGSIYKYSILDDAWEPGEKVNIGDSDFDNGINDMWMSDNGDLYVAADVLYSWDLQSSMLIAADPDLPNVRLLSIYGAASNDIYLAGEQTLIEEEVPTKGLLFHFNGVSMVEEESNLEADPIWSDIYGDGDGKIYAVGLDGTVIMKNTSDGNEWHEFALQLDHDALNAVWGDGGVIFVAGQNGFMAKLTSDSRGWQKIDLDTDADLVKIYGYSKNEVIVAAENGAVWATFNGKDFSPYDTGMSATAVTGIWGDDMSNTFFASLGGDVVNGELEPHEIPDGDEDGDIIDGDNVDGDEEVDTDDIVDGDEEIDAEETADADEEVDADPDEVIDGDLVDVDDEVADSDEEIPVGLQCGAHIGEGACSADSCLCYANPLPFKMDVRGMCTTPNGKLFVAGSDGAVVRKDTGSWAIVNLGGAEILDVAAIDNDNLFLLTSDALYRHDGLGVATFEIEPDDGVFLAMSADAAGKLYVLEKFQTARGDNFRVHYYSGSAWSVLGTAQAYNSTDIWAADSTHVYVSGTSVYKWNGSVWASMVPDSATAYQRIFGTGVDEFYTLTNIYFYRYNGSGAMEKLTYDAQISQVSDLWGTDSDDLYLVGKRSFDGASSLYYYNGTSWTHPADTIIADKTFNRVFGSGSDLFVSSTDGDFYTYNITDGLDAVSSAVSRSALYDTWVFADDDIYAAGEDSTVLHYDGSIWTSLTPDPLLGLEADAVFEQLWGDSAGRLYLYAGGNEIILYDPSTTSWDSISVNVTLDHFVALSPTSIYTGNMPYSCNGTTCLPVVWGGIDQHDTINEYWTNGSLLYAATPWGIYKMNSGQLDKVYPAGATVTPFMLVSGSSDTALAAAGTTGGSALVIVQKGTSGWSVITGDLPTTLTPVDLEYVDGKIFFIGSDASATLHGYYYDGTEWTELLHFPGAGVNSVHSAASAPYMVCGDGGVLMDFSLSAE